MALAHLSSRITPEHASQAAGIREALIRAGLYHGSQRVDGRPAEALPARWRIAPIPFLISPDELSFFQGLGAYLLAFYRALNRLYQESIRGAQPPWVAAYLDQGKPESLITYSRMKRLRNHLPLVIRPDLIPTEHGMVITELDSVPGGIGLTGCLATVYAELSALGQSADIVAGPDGMVSGFAAMMRDCLEGRPGCVAIVVSEESRDYRLEMAWLAARLANRGLETYCIEPRDIRFTEEGLWVLGDAGERPVAGLYRFFELFDLPNIPKAELMLYSAKKERVSVTPPFKPALEEKLAFALLHHPLLAPFWRKALGEETFGILVGLMPRTWILDPHPIPPSATIPGLSIGGRAVNDWRDLAIVSQRDRRYVIKPSGFSDLAWGSRGVAVGHDLSQEKWAETLKAALAAFATTPYILQEFHNGRQFDLSYYDGESGSMVPMSGRTRLSPYYFVTGERAELGGILATVCPLDKKLIHGMRDAMLAPCAVARS